MITQKLIDEIHKLPLSDVSLIVDECIESLGMCDVQTCKNALGINRSRVYQLMNHENTKEVGIHKFLMINVLIEQNETHKQNSN